MDEEDKLANLARALGHPARIRILQLLSRTPGCIGGEIVGAVGLAQSTVSEHLRILKDAGLITGEIAPPRICYSLAPGALAPLAGFFDDLSTQQADNGRCEPAPAVRDTRHDDF
jgi:ArsR family transcriptional regulator